MGSGFADEEHGTERLDGIYLAQVVNVERNPNDDTTSGMEMLGRVKFYLPGICDPESGWAFPQGGGAAQWGSNFVPPVGADVYVMFLDGDIDNPIWFPAYHGVPVDPETNEAKSQAFPEFTDPRIGVFGFGPFRLVVDTRVPSASSDPPRQLTLKAFKLVNEVEESVVEIVLDADNNSLLIRGTRAVRIEADALIDIDAPKVQIKGRTVMPTTRPIN